MKTDHKSHFSFCETVSVGPRGMPATVIINNHHNHATVNANSRSLCKIDPHMRDKFYAYFVQGMSAAATPTNWKWIHMSLIHGLSLKPMLLSTLNGQQCVSY